ncbi:hypothetical protein CEK26_009884 [Fusarium fujikuroi]|nr:hypothetical protein CEK27_009904 [Fusarium fujikuroi]QGI83172.1 hypothetical protein CEK25_009901 [Fusarium fujikuroi]QGI96815.1 hypothetical protein CEK26_009884 [Fusarium fujikuroi]
MAAIGEKQRLAICYGYILVAVAQLSLVIVASTLHNDTTPFRTWANSFISDTKAAYKSSQRATRTTSGLAFLLMMVQVYLSAIITLLGCPIIYIAWFIIAQIVSTVYFCYIPWRYPKSVAPPVEDEWFLADQDDLELRILSYKMDPASLNN